MSEVEFYAMYREGVARNLQKCIQTHTIFTEVDKMKAISIKPEECQKFADLYFALSKKPLLTEKIACDAAFPLFLDLDWDITKIPSECAETIRVYCSERVDFIIRSYQRQIEQLSALKTPRYVLSCREVYKVHCYFPDVHVDAACARALRAYVLNDLRSNWPDEEWDDVLDKSVYSTGLRMPLSPKTGMGTKSSTQAEQHKKIFGSDMALVYPLPKNVSFSEISLLRQVKMNVNTPTPDHIRKHHNRENYQPIAEFINNLFKQTTFISVKKSDKNSWYIALSSKWCPNVQKEHVSNHQYGILSTQGFVAKCHDADCVNLRYNEVAFKKLPGNVREYITPTRIMTKMQRSAQNANQDSVTDAEKELSVIINDHMNMNADDHSDNVVWRLHNAMKKQPQAVSRWIMQNSLQCLVDREYHHAKYGVCGLECQLNKSKIMVGCARNGHHDRTMELKTLFDHIPDALSKYKVELEVLVTEKANTDLAELISDMFDVAADQGLRLGLYQMFKPVAGKPCVFVPDLEYKEWIKENFVDDARLLADPIRMDKMVHALMNGCVSRVPQIKIDRDIIAFKNGVFNLATTSFKLFGDLTENDAVKVAKHYIDYDFDIPASCSEIDPAVINTPSLDTIMSYQMTREDGSVDWELIHWIYALIGRLHFEVGSRDNLEITPILWGRSGSAKSTLGRMIQAQFPQEQVATFNKTLEDRFGLESLYDKSLIIAYELPDDVQNVLDKTLFQSMSSGESVSVARKRINAITVEWKVPMLFIGNQLPDWKDAGGESVSRRLASIHFKKIVPLENQKTDLIHKLIKEELPAIIVKCVLYYHRLILARKGESFWKICPDYFRNEKQSALETSNPFLAWLRKPSDENGIHKVAADDEQKRFVRWTDLKQHVLMCFGKQKRLTTESPEFGLAGINIEKRHVCHACLSPIGSTCCELYNPEKRKKQYLTYSISHLDMMPEQKS